MPEQLRVCSVGMFVICVDPANSQQMAAWVLTLLLQEGP